MQIVIDIDDERYKDIQRIATVQLKGRTPTLEQAIASGTPLPKGHGKLIDEKEANALIAEGKNGKAYFGTVNKDWEVIDFLKTVPTIIEADEAGEEE